MGEGRHGHVRDRRVSLYSVKSAVGDLPKKKACRCVAQWMTVPQLAVKTLQLVHNTLKLSKENYVVAYDHTTLNAPVPV